MIAALATVALVQAQGVDPRAAPSVYATHNYALTFRTPPKVTYCPLPDGWVGSDHGTVLFLVPPRRCGGAGFPSSSRGFAPSDTPRIEVYYGYTRDGPPSVSRCRLAGTIRLINGERPLCASTDGRLTVLETLAPYDAGEAAEVSLRLVTQPRRLAADRKALAHLALSLHTCRVLDFSPQFGSGAPCPNAPWF
ncbi:MAG TPA: hypothetical protein VGL58_03705 [Caulobacteraceae bacterium]|jgi:hypothetical protein